MEMNLRKISVLAILAVLLAVSIILPLASCTNKYPYQGTFTGNWSGNLTILGQNIPLGGTLDVTIDEKGNANGTVNGSKDVSPATLTAKVDENGNMTGMVSFKLLMTTFNSSWQGKVTVSGDTLVIQGTWTSEHGSGTFTGAGTQTK
jgi:hypothetical protein